MKNIGCVFLVLTLLMTSHINSYSQEKNDLFSFGIGSGMDYGGFGINLLAYPQKNIGLFAGAGYALAGVGYNVGVKIRFLSNKHIFRIAPYLIGMYGYNTAIAVVNATQFNKLFYGPTIGFGLDFRFRLQNVGYWSMAILFPIRGSDVDDYINNLQTTQNITFSSTPSPVAVSLGYRFIIN
jgi:hypothetical protein